MSEACLLLSVIVDKIELNLADHRPRYHTHRWRRARAIRPRRAGEATRTSTDGWESPRVTTRAGSPSEVRGPSPAETGRETHCVYYTQPIFSVVLSVIEILWASFFRMRGAEYVKMDDNYLNQTMTSFSGNLHGSRLSSHTRARVAVSVSRYW